MKKQRKQKKDQFLGASTKSKRKKIRGGQFYDPDSLDEIEIGVAYWEGGQNKQKVLDEFAWADPNDIQKIIDKGPPQ